MTDQFKARCDNCGWTGTIGLKARCRRCGASGGSMTSRAAEKLRQATMSTIERVNDHPREVRFKRIQDLQGAVVRVIPKKNARTAKATAAAREAHPAPVDEVARLTASGLSAKQIGLRLGKSDRWIRKLRARASKAGHTP